MVRFIASKSARLPTLIAPTVMPRPVSNNGSSIAPDGGQARADQAEMSAHGQGLQRFRDRSRPTDLDDAIDAAASVNSRAFTSPIRAVSV